LSFVSLKITELYRQPKNSIILACFDYVLEPAHG
jgi:hypothetical protein